MPVHKIRILKEGRWNGALAKWNIGRAKRALVKDTKYTTLWIVLHYQGAVIPWRIQGHYYNGRERVVVHGNDGGIEVRRDWTRTT